MNTSELAKKYGRDDAERLLAVRFFERYTRANATGVPQYLGFLSPAERALLLRIAEGLHLSGVSFEGGYPDAERTYAVLCPSGCRPDSGPPIEVLAIKNKGETLSHRDLLGALLALGIERETVGDILPEANPPLILCERVMAGYISDHLERAGRCRVHAKPGMLSAIPPPRTERHTFTVLSLRLDSVVAESFSLSRPDAADAIRAGRVFLNWRQCDSVSATVSEGDRISLRGSGKVVVAELGGVSRKGRQFVGVDRYL